MRFLIVTTFLFFSYSFCAQAPLLIPYQAVARDEQGLPFSNGMLNVRFTIHDEQATGPIVWQEIQTSSTNELGLFSLKLGSTVSLSSVNWPHGSKFMQVELDLGNGFVDLGTQQMLSVPYAIASGNVYLNVSETGDTLHVGDGNFVIIPGISAANNFTTGISQHTCGQPNVHNPNLTYGSVTDQQGNVYRTVSIGMQEWMAENLKTSIYRNGDTIPEITDQSEWSSTNDGAWCYYNNQESNDCPFGKLYNWFAATDLRGLCPVGWHVPGVEEFDMMIAYLGGVSVAGGKLKSVGTTSTATSYWVDPNGDATNETGFSAIPGGVRYWDGVFMGFAIASPFWTSTDESGYSQDRVLYNSNGVVIGNYDGKRKGVQVRCLRD